MLPLLSVVGSAISGFFGFKKQQGETIEKAIGTLGAVQSSDAAYAEAAAKSIQALYNSGSPVEKLWRPVAMWIFMALIIARWFGYVPEHLSPSEVEHVYTWFEIGLIGYMPLRSMDKWMQGFQIGSILKTFIAKKIG